MSDERDAHPSKPTPPPTPRSMPLPRASPKNGDTARPILSGADAEATLSRDADATLPHDADATARHYGDSTRTLTPAQARGVALPASIGPYKILGLLGVGGFGAVYEAEQPSPKRRVALKVIKPGYVSPSLLKRFEREAEVLGRLQHPGIAQIYEAGTADDGNLQQPYFAMELVRGTSLTRFAEEKKLDLRQRLDLVTRICDAVQYAHQQGVVHRDLKPGNILVDANGQPKILDFGIAKIAGNEAQLSTMETQVGHVVGTLPYMSPEQARGEVDKLDTRSDIYALGVIAYELLAGKLPYDLKQAVILEAIRVICEDEPTPLSSIDRRYGGDIQTIIAKAMAKERDRRYASASELASDIKRFLSDEPIAARPPSTWYQLSKFAKRNKSLVRAFMIALIALLAGLTAAVWALARTIESNRSLQRAEQEARASANVAKLEKENVKRERDRADAQAEAARLQAAVAKEANYPLSITLAAQYIRDLRFSEADRILDRVPEARRAWEWRRLRASTDRSVLRIPIAEQAWRLSASGKGSVLVYTDGDKPLNVYGIDDAAVIATVPREPGTIAAAIRPSGDAILLIIRRVQEGKQTWEAQIRDLRGTVVHRFEIPATNRAVWSPNGERIAMIHRSGEVSIWNAQRGKAESSLRDEGFQPIDVAWSPDGTRLAVTYVGGRIAVLSASPMRQIASRQVFQESADHLRWSPKGGLLAMATGSIVNVLHSDTLEEVDAFERRHGVSVVEWMPGSESELITNENRPYLVRCSAAGRGTRGTAREFPSGTRFRDIAVWGMPGATRFVTLHDHEIRFWSEEALELDHQFELENGLFSAPAFSPSGKRLAVLTRDRAIQIRSTIDGRVLTHWEPEHPPILLSWSPDEKSLVLFAHAHATVSGGEKSPHTWLIDVESHATRAECKGRLTHWSADNKLAVVEPTGGSATSHYRVVDGTSLRPVDVRPGSGEPIGWAAGDAALLVLDGQRRQLLSFGRQGEGPSKPVITLSQPFAKLRLGPGGRYLIASTSEGPGAFLNTWDLTLPATPIATSENGTVLWEWSWNKEGDRVACTGESGVSVYDPRTWQKLLDLPVALPSEFHRPLAVSWLSESNAIAAIVGNRVVVFGDGAALKAADVK